MFALSLATCITLPFSLNSFFSIRDRSRFYTLILRIPSLPLPSTSEKREWKGESAQSQGEKVFFLLFSEILEGWKRVHVNIRITSGIV